LPCLEKGGGVDMETEEKIELEKIEVKKVEKILATATMVEY
jgi:hypothetical protein